MALDVYNGAWSSGNTVYTAYVTLPQYRAANAWDVWPIQVTATVSGADSNVACQ